MIKLQNIYKSYMTSFGRKVIFKDLSFSIPTNDSLGIIGYNGSGKSTLLRMLSGVESPDSGVIQRDTNFSWPIGFSGGLNGSLTGAENAKFVARIYGKDIKSVVDQTRDFAEIGDYFYLPVKTYSSGMKARLAFGLSMAIDFDTYLIDEVVAVGDKGFQKKAQDTFNDKVNGKTVIIVSHSFSILESFASQFAILHNNQFELFDNINSAKQRYMSL